MRGLRIRLLFRASESRVRSVMGIWGCKGGDVRDNMRLQLAFGMGVFWNSLRGKNYPNFAIVARLPPAPN